MSYLSSCGRIINVAEHLQSSLARRNERAGPSTAKCRRYSIRDSRRLQQSSWFNQVRHYLPCTLFVLRSARLALFTKHNAVDFKRTDYVVLYFDSQHPSLDAYCFHPIVWTPFGLLWLLARDRLEDPILARRNLHDISYVQPKIGPRIGRSIEDIWL
jgi:hypothetical protein